MDIYFQVFRSFWPSFGENINNSLFRITSHLPSWNSFRYCQSHALPQATDQGHTDSTEDLNLEPASVSGKKKKKNTWADSPLWCCTLKSFYLFLTQILELQELLCFLMHFTPYPFNKIILLLKLTGESINCCNPLCVIIDFKKSITFFRR